MDKFSKNNKERPLNGYGYLYVLTGNDMPTNKYKIGMTSNLNSRLSSFSSCVHGAKFVFTSTLMPDISSKEQEVFSILKKYRCEPNREFFVCPLSEIQVAFEQVKNSSNNKTVVNIVNKNDKISEKFVQNINSFQVFQNSSYKINHELLYTDNLNNKIEILEETKINPLQINESIHYYVKAFHNKSANLLMYMKNPQMLRQFEQDFISRLEFCGKAIIEKPSVYEDQDQIFVEYPVLASADFLDKTPRYLRHYLSLQDLPNIIRNVGTIQYPLQLDTTFHSKNNAHNDIDYQQAQQMMLDICKETANFISLHQLQIDVKFNIVIISKHCKVPVFSICSLHELRNVLQTNCTDIKSKMLEFSMSLLQRQNLSFDDLQIIGFCSEWQEQITTKQIWNHRLYVMYGWNILTQNKNAWYPKQPSASLQHLFDNILQSTLTLEKGGAQYKFLFDTLFYKAVETELYLLFTTVNKDDNSRETKYERISEFLGKCLLVALPNYLLGIVNGDQTARIGNPTKHKLTDFFEFVCGTVIANNILLYVSSFQSFIEQMLLFRDIRWFLDLVMIWGCNEKTALFVKLVQKVIQQNQHLFNGMSRDNKNIINSICKNKFVPSEFAKQMIFQNNTHALFTLQTKVKFDLMKEEFFKHAIYYGPTSQVNAFFTHFGKPLASLEMTIELKNVEQYNMMLDLHTKQGKAQLLVWKAYQVCAKNGWYEQALWIYSMSNTKMNGIHLQTAVKHMHESFVYDIISSMGLCNDEKWMIENGKIEAQNEEEDKWKFHWLLSYVINRSHCLMDYVFNEDDFSNQTHFMKYIDTALTEDLHTMLTDQQAGHDEVCETFMKKAMFYNRVLSFKYADTNLPALLAEMKKQNCRQHSNDKTFISIVEGLYKHPSFNTELIYVYTSLHTILHKLLNKTL